MPRRSALAAHHNAGVGKRFAALVYDLLLVAAISFAYGALLLAFKVEVLGIAYAPGEKATIGTAGLVGWLLVIVLFYSFFWRYFGQTLGMKAWRLQLTRRDGGNPSLGQCLLRCLIAPISLAPMGLGYFCLWFDPERLTLHDRLSQTRVLQQPRQHP